MATSNRKIKNTKGAVGRYKGIKVPKAFTNAAKKSGLVSRSGRDSGGSLGSDSK